MNAARNRVRLLRTLLMAVVIVSLTAAPVASQEEPAAPPTEPTELPWVSLGPPGPSSTDDLAVSDDGKLIIAVQSSTLSGGQGSQLIRTRDGGATWETLPSPGPYPDLTLAPSSVGPVLYAAQTRFPSETGASAWLREVLRSVDLGDSWETVVTVDQRDGPAPVLVVTPTLDGPVLAKIGALLFHAADPRAAWGEVMLPDELQVQDLAPSPAYAQDGLIFAALIRTASWYGSGPVPEPVVTAHVRSLGVAVSSDGGLTWQPVGSQPEIDGVSYRHVRTLAVSPTFATDRTLFVHAWGPYLSPAERGGQPVRVSHESVLFRSRDAGATWEVVDRDNLGSGGNYAAIGLSPRFGEDGVGLVARTTPASINTCTLSRTEDGGTTWVELRRKTGKAQSCPAPRMLTQGGKLRAFLGTRGISEWSDDGGATWARASSTAGSSPVLVPATGEEATIYAGGSRGGVYALGPGAAATDGRLPCALQPAPQLAALLNAEPSLRAPLGCPQELERPVTVRERELTLPREDPVHGYWIEGQDTNWIAVRRERAPFDPSGARWTTESKLTRPWPADGHSVRTGTIQRFEGGMILTLANDGGGRTALVFVNLGGAYQRELP